MTQQPPWPQEPEQTGAPGESGPSPYGGTYGPPPQYAPPQYGPPAPSGPSPRPATRPMLLAGVGGAVAAAVIVLVLALAGALPAKSSSGSSTAALTMPGTAAGLPRYAQAGFVKKLTDSSKLVAAHAYADSHTAAELTSAYGGAAAAVQSYASNDGMTEVSVWAVRAATPGPVVAHENPDYEGLAAPSQQIEHIGQQSCFVFTRAQAKGTPVPPDAVSTSFCQRSSGALTVWLRVDVQSTFSQSPSAVARAADAVWNEVAA